MKRGIALAVCLLLLCSSACAQTLPDVGAALGAEVQQQMADYQFSQEYGCDVWVYPRDSRTDELLAKWIVAALDSGYTVSATEVEGQAAYCLEDAEGLYALMFPEYQGMVMLMVQQGMAYAPAVATPEPTAQPAAPSANVGEWDWVEVEKDCPSCVSGWCRLCNGTGVYRLYGQAVDCSVYCNVCDGAGTYVTGEYQYIRVN